MSKDKCPGCKEVFTDCRNPAKPEHCAWCGYNYDTKQNAGFEPASSFTSEDTKKV